ncbi:hypothetical protein [Halovenus sp. HT40]|uniref:hypothetical protein n=1 Tax=Halovenus sp. HT40 TaxID=3126691 RepID=UPI00300ED518
MPNTSHDLTPRYKDGIDADVLETHVAEVNDSGYVDHVTDLTHHTAAWVSLTRPGQLNTTTFDGNRKERRQTYVQSDGSINIGTEEHAGERVLVIILDEQIDTDD